jgi:hypothetical protein
LHYLGEFFFEDSCFSQTGQTQSLSLGGD